MSIVYRILVLAVAIIAGSSVPVLAAAPRMETIVAVVNADAISESDLADRMKLVIASAGMPDNSDIRDKLRPQIMNVLIDEKLQLQEAARLEIEVEPKDIEQGFAQLAAQNQMSAEQFRGLLKRGGVSIKTLEDQIHAQLAWSKVVQAEIRPQIAIADNEVEAVLERLRGSEGKTEYLVSEIFLPVETPADEANVKRLADKLTREMLEGRAPFTKVASQFSQAAGASKGGDMGWVQEGQLPDELDRRLSTMQEGDLSNPVRSLAGFHILYLRKKRLISAENIPSSEQVMQSLGFERLDRMQQRYLMDLKTQAFIEHRV
ncbi:MAG: peptidylprolyl isomerase [Rhodospirillales bacterium]|nr:peptidylprolyl isomerase [Rhodospirillales bacterium]MCB9997064.1 peptidylprolyl isomerase [Rhodospirillales bacterium]